MLQYILGSGAIIMSIWIAYESGFQAGYRFGSQKPKDATPEDCNNPNNPWNKQQ